MQIIPDHVVEQRLRDMGGEAEHIKVTADKSVLVWRAQMTAQRGLIRRVPVLFVHLCIEGGGQLRQKAGISDLDVCLQPGDIGVAPPNLRGSGQWPEMRVISVGIAVDALVESFGADWPAKLKKSALTKIVRDPLVEATMMDIGYTRANEVSDATLIHAAHMIAHQLLDSPFDETEVDPGITALPQKTVARVQEMLSENLDRHVSVDEMAEHVGISRHHFSRKFKAATGETPHQYAIRGKLDHAAKLLTEEEESSVISISQMLGYSNPAQFAKIFRRHFGQSPKTWRKRNSR